MDKALLVTIDVLLDAKIVEALDRSGLSISVVLWAYLSEYEDWRLVLASRKLDEVNILETYGLVRTALQSADFSYEQTPTLLILRMSDPFIRDLLGDRFVEDGIAYRIR